MTNIFSFAKAFYLEKSDLVHLVIVFLAIAFTLWRVLLHSFLIGWDDQWFVLNHYTSNGLAAKNLYLIITTFYYGQYAPINQLYYTTIYEFFELRPFAFHIGSLVLHGINVVLIYYFLKNIGCKLFHHEDLKNRQIAFLATFIFAISPINLESIAWVAASKVLLYAFFYLLALNFYCWYLKTTNPVWYHLIFLCFVLSFGSKEQAITLPISLILIDYVYDRHLYNIKIWYEKAPFIILSLLFGLITIQSQLALYVERAEFYRWDQRIILSMYTFTEYFVKSLFPLRISYLYPFPFQIGEDVPKWMWIYPVFIPIILFWLFNFVKKKWIVFGLCFFVLHLLIVLNLFSLSRFSVIADRYAYIATIGLYFILSTIVVKYCFTFKKRYSYVTVLTIYLFLLISYTSLHSKVWNNSITLKEELRTVIQGRSDYANWLREHKNE